VVCRSASACRRRSATEAVELGRDLLQAANELARREPLDDVDVGAQLLVDQGPVLGGQACGLAGDQGGLVGVDASGAERRTRVRQLGAHDHRQRNLLLSTRG
jgi:hypothetical protein